MPYLSAPQRAALYAGVQPSLSMDFTKATALPGFVSYSRTGTATYFDAVGTLQTAAGSVPRFDYDPITHAPRGLLCEDYGTNYLLWCRDLTNAAWTKTSMTTAKTATGIDGTANSATTLTASAGNATVLQVITRASAARISGAYIKRRTGSGTINMTQDGGTTWTVVTATAAWTRVSIPSATVTNPSVGFRIVTSADAIDVDYVQHEEQTFLTSAIPTTTAAVTRNVDVTSFPASAFGNSFLVGTWVVNVIPITFGPMSSPRIIGTDGGVSADMLNFSTNTGNAETWDGNGVVTTSNSGTVGSTFKCGMSYDASGRSVCLNGGTVATDPTFAAANIASITTYYIMQMTAAANAAHGWVSSIKYYPKRLGNSTLAQLTT